MTTETPAVSEPRIKLYSSPTSPYARKVRVLVAELGIEDQVEEVMVDPHASPAELLAVNPLSKIPALMTEQGIALPDSKLVIEYLLARGSGLAALPEGEQRWAALRLQQLGDGIIDAAVATVMERRRPEGIVYTTFLDRQAAVINRALEALEADAGSLSSGEPRLVEIAVGVALAYLDFRMPYVEWRPKFGALNTWFTLFSQRTSMVKTQPPA